MEVGNGFSIYFALSSFRFEGFCVIDFSTKVEIRNKRRGQLPEFTTPPLRCLGDFESMIPKTIRNPTRPRVATELRRRNCLWLPLSPVGCMKAIANRRDTEIAH